MEQIMLVVLALVLMIGAPSMQSVLANAADTEQEAGIASDAQGRPCTFGPSHDECYDKFLERKALENQPTADQVMGGTDYTPGDEKGTLPTRDACYDAGLDDGQHGIFFKYAYGDYCGPTNENYTQNKYYRGFIDGLAIYLGHGPTKP